ncbi:MAG: hypothetical protein K6F81_04310 [Acholeplasmatales bacterium]|nr:hypothetical protein [Acholeplasmatales bacterium]
MKFKKIIIPLLLGLFSTSLMSCSLFSDEDIEVKNSFTPYVEKEAETGVTAGGVLNRDVDGLPNIYCFKSISYAKNDAVVNTYKVGGANENQYFVNDNNDYSGNKSRNNYDLYVPTNLNKSANNTIILFIHGGAWVSGFKTDVNDYVYEFAKKGYISATIKYSLLKRTMDDKSLSIFRNLDEIDACIASIKEVLKSDLGFDDTKLNLVIGGASSGSHLAMLYSYSRGDKSPLPIKFIIDAVGPVDIKSYSWKKFKNATPEVLNAGITYSALMNQVADDNIAELPVSGEDYTWNNYNTMKIANGMCGVPFTQAEIEASTDENKEEIINPNEASNSLTSTGGGEDLLSVTYWIENTTNDYPIICAYGGKDSIVGISQYGTLENCLVNNSITHEFIYFKDSEHTEISEKADSVKYHELINKIDEWAKTL